MTIPWNLTRHLLPKKNADVIIVSPAKAGRTWLRVMINKYLSLKYGATFSLDDLHGENPAIPSIVYEHWLWQHCTASLKRRLRGRYIIPARILAQKKIVLLVRDPRDTIVSLYFQATRRGRYSTRADAPSMREFVRDRKTGIGALVRILNLMHDKLRDHPRCLIVKYETMKADPRGELGRILQFVDGAPDSQLVDSAAAFAEFDNMKKMEQDGAFDSPKLRPKDSADPNSYKVRKGKIGGYVDYLEKADLEYFDAQLAKLHPDFGYAPHRAQGGTDGAP